jgi:regulator of protease activity HflC (stomatin/prohibitin superfamily)
MNAHKQNLGLDWDERVLPSIGNEVVKSVVAQYNAEQLLTQREKVSRAVSSSSSGESFGMCVCVCAWCRWVGVCRGHAMAYAGGFRPCITSLPQVRESLMTRAADFGIILEDVAITHLSFGTEFTKAVESKQVAEQDAERAKFVVMLAEQVRKSRGLQVGRGTINPIGAFSPLLALPQARCPLHFSDPPPSSFHHLPNPSCQPPTLHSLAPSHRRSVTPQSSAPRESPRLPS